MTCELDWDLICLYRVQLLLGMKSYSVRARRRIVVNLSNGKSYNEINHVPIKKLGKITVKKKKNYVELILEDNPLMASGGSSSSPTEQNREKEFEFPSIKEAVMDAHIEKWLERERGSEVLGLYPIEDSFAQENKTSEEDFVDSILKVPKGHGI